MESASDGTPVGRIQFPEKFALSYKRAGKPPGFAIFQELVTAWVVCPARRTVTGMMRGGGLVAKRPHDAYHRLVRSAS
jgi:hypothetical protein